MAQEWKEKLSFLDSMTKKGHPIRFGDDTVYFYPLSVLKLPKLKSLVGPLGKAFASMTASDQNDISQRTIRTTEQNGDKSEVLEINAIAADLASLRQEQKERAISELLDALFDKANMEVIGELLMDSMREVFPRGSSDNPTVTEFLSAYGDLPVMVKLLEGMLGANKGVFDPLGIKADDMMASVKTRLATRAGTDETAPADMPTTETRGKSSQTNSNGSQPEDTDSTG